MVGGINPLRSSSSNGAASRRREPGRTWDEMPEVADL
jgi:hypothetical protein